MDYPHPMMNDNTSGHDDVEGDINGPGNPSNDVSWKRRRHNPCRSSVLNLGCNLRLGVPVHPAPDKCTDGHVTQCVPRHQLPRTRLSRNSVPSQERVLTMLLKCLPVDCRSKFDKHFRECVKEIGPHASPGEPMLCATPVRWIGGGLQEVFSDLPVPVDTGSRFDVRQTRSLDDIFLQSGMMTPFRQDFILVDVILNRSFVPVDQNSAPRGGGVPVPMRCFGKEDLASDADHQFRSAITYIPSAGILYCSQERRDATVGFMNTLNALEMSWLRLPSHGCEFGPGGYVKCLYNKGGVSAWKVSALTLDIALNPDLSVLSAGLHDV